MKSFIEFFTSCWCWVLGLMFLSYLLGWWLARKFFGGSGDGDCCDELDACKSRYADLEAKYNQLLKGTGKVSTVPSGSPGLASGLAAGKFNPYAKLKEDNLQIIEGVGPKMEEVLNKNGINSWKALADKTPDQLRTMLDSEGGKYKIIDPTTWSDQAQLAVGGNWEELIEMQKSLDTGKTDTLGNTDSKLEKIMVKLGILKKWKQDDLKAVEGIGPKIEELFHKAGIKTWKQLSETPLEKMQEILDAAGNRYKLADPGTWAQQAGLAAAGKFDELQALQDELDGGR
jgi:predicted flap endonuclease-1-like 5' DNA nuclease